MIFENCQYIIIRDVIYMDTAVDKPQMESLIRLGFAEKHKSCMKIVFGESGEHVLYLQDLVESNEMSSGNKTDDFISDIIKKFHLEEE